MDVFGPRRPDHFLYVRLGPRRDGAVPIEPQLAVVRVVPVQEFDHLIGRRAWRERHDGGVGFAGLRMKVRCNQRQTRKCESQKSHRQVAYMNGFGDLRDHLFQSMRQEQSTA